MASLVFGIGGVYPLAYFGGITAIVLGIIAIGQIRNSGGTQNGRELAAAGIALGALSTVFWVSFTIYLMVSLRHLTF